MRKRSVGWQHWWRVGCEKKLEVRRLEVMGEVLVRARGSVLGLVPRPKRQ